MWLKILFVITGLIYFIMHNLYVFFMRKGSMPCLYLMVRFYEAAILNSLCRLISWTSASFPISLPHRVFIIPSFGKTYLAGPMQLGLVISQ